MFTRSTPGFCFKDNRLNIFAPKAVMLVHGWPDLRAVIKTHRKNRWSSFEPEFRMVLPYRRKVSRSKKKPANIQLELGFDGSSFKPRTPSVASQRKRAFDAFRFSLPKPVAARVERFTNHQWPILRLLEKEPRASDLCRANPALAFALVHAKVFRPRRVADSLEFAAKRVFEKQRTLLSCLRFPDTNASVKILAKLEAESVCVTSLNRLRTDLQNEPMRKILSHLPKLNCGVLDLLSLRSEEVVLPVSLIHEVACKPSEKYRARVADTMRENLFMAERMDKKISFPKLSSIAKLQLLNEKLTEEFCKFEKLRRENRRFPKPPLLGTESIVPIRTEWELVREGHEQHNCVASYAEAVIGGITYIYRVLQPQRCTLSIELAPDGTWALGQLKTHYNGMPSRATCDTVDLWLDQYRIAV